MRTLILTENLKALPPARAGNASTKRSLTRSIELQVEEAAGGFRRGSMQQTSDWAMTREPMTVRMTATR